MRATIYLRKQELEKYLENRGYTLKTIRRLLLDEFGYKNSKHFVSEFTNLSKGVLDIKTAYKSKEEYEIIVFKLSEIVQFLKEELKNHPTRLHGRDIIFFQKSHPYSSYRDCERTEALYYNVITTVFRKELSKEIREKLGLYEIGISI